MPTTQMSEVIHRLRSALLRDEADLTDGQLLEAFVSRRDTAALEALVRRHGPMVWGVCRRVLRNHHDTEDAFQATFLVLVRKASSITPPAKVGNWLYGVAHQTALNARATRAKRHVREKQVTDMPEPAVTGQALWVDLQPLLDQEVSLLPEKYRTVIVLCDLEGKRKREVAKELDCPEGTVASRLARGRVMLAKRLARHGLAVSGGMLAAVLSQKAASASVPTSVMSSTIKAVTLVAAGQAATGVISGTVAVLTEGVVKSMLLNKLKTVTTVLFVLAVICFGGVSIHHMADAQQGPTDRPAARSGKEQKHEGKRENADPKDSTVSKLQGTWVAVSGETGGKQIPENRFKEGNKVTLVISADNFIATASPAGKDAAGMPSDATWKGQIKLDSTKQPGEFDLIACSLILGNLKDKELKTGGAQGIYELKGDTLKVCYETAQQRPTGFKTKPNSSQKLFVFERQKPREKSKEEGKNPKGNSANDDPNGPKDKKKPSERAGKDKAVREIYDRELNVREIYLSDHQIFKRLFEPPLPGRERGQSKEPGKR